MVGEIIKRVKSIPVQVVVLGLFVALVTLLTVFFVFNEGDQTIINEKQENTNNTDQPQIVEVCSEELLRRAASVLDASQVDKLSSISEEVLGLDQYNNDINCLYIVVNYNIYTSNASSADSELVKLEGLYSSGQRYSSVLGEKFRTTLPEDLRVVVNFLTEQELNLEKNNKIQGPIVPGGGR